MKAFAVVLAVLAGCADSSPQPGAAAPPASQEKSMNGASFARYIALGDSISIDIYPAADVARRYPGKASTDRLGASSLFYRNDDQLWPEFAGRDLRTLYPQLQFRQHSEGFFGSRGAADDLTADGATTHSLLGQVARIEPGEEPTLVTITAGGNDLLGEIGFRGSPHDSITGNPVPAIFGRLRDAVTRLLELRPNSVVLIGTVYDPSDGTNRLPGYPLSLDREAEWLREFNDAIRQLVTTDERLRLADMQKHFLGHGLEARERDRWYLQESIIEPNARGASEVRRIWLEAIGQ
jgi:lysophospholipase L1-like esterase